VDLFHAFALLFLASAGLLVGLSLLVVSRKAMRDRRESASARLRRRYRRALENFGYRQWLALVRTRALWTVMRPETGWGEMTRVGFSEPATPSR
jgi:hypothetical protein